MISRHVSSENVCDRREKRIDVAGFAGGVVQQNRDCAEIGFNRFRHAADRFGLRDIAGIAFGAPVMSRGDLGAGVLQRLFVEIEQGDIGAEFGEAFGKALSQDPASAGDHRGAPLRSNRSLNPVMAWSPWIAAVFAATVPPA